MKKEIVNASEKISKRFSLLWLNKKSLSLRKKTIIIVGVERGGTSMVAGVIRALGIYGGKRLGRNHESPSFLTEDKARLAQIIKLMNNESDVWWVKMPKLSLNLEFILSNVENPLVIFVNRNWTAVANSWLQRTNSKPLNAMMHSLNYYTNILNIISEKNVAALSVDYEYACKNPKKFLDEFVDCLQMKFNKHLLDKAVKMINIDGGGYIDMPEFNFTVNPLDNKSLQLIDNKKGKKFKLLNFDKFIKLKSENDNIELKIEEELTRNILINVDIKYTNILKKFDNILRIYADFNQGFIPVHAHRPILIHGNNNLILSFDNLPKKIGFGVMGDGSLDIKLNSVVEIKGNKITDYINEDKFKLNKNFLKIRFKDLINKLKFFIYARR